MKLWKSYRRSEKKTSLRFSAISNVCIKKTEILIGYHNIASFLKPNSPCLLQLVNINALPSNGTQTQQFQFDTLSTRCNLQCTVIHTYLQEEGH